MPAVFTTLDRGKPFFDWTYNIVLFICKLLLIADILIASWAVITRLNAVQVNGEFIFSFIPSAPWSEEIVLTLMSYMAVLSAALAIRRGGHIRMTAFDRFLPKILLKILDIIADLAVLALAYIMITEGWAYAQSIGQFGKYTSMPNLSRFWMYLPIPVAGVAMAVFEIEILYNHVRSFFVKEEKGD
ncbi:MAG: TRAP transporter small permease [Eubacteriales bacterium]